MRPPRVRAITFFPCNCCIYCMELGQYRTLFCMENSSIPIQPYIQFLSVSSGICLRLPSDSTSQWTSLPLANSSYCQAWSGLSPLSYSPCRAHHKREFVVLLKDIKKDHLIDSPALKLKLPFHLLILKLLINVHRYNFLNIQ